MPKKKRRRRTNARTVIKDAEGTTVFKEEKIVKVIFSLFKNVFTSTEENREETDSYALSPAISDA